MIPRPYDSDRTVVSIPRAHSYHINVVSGTDSLKPCVAEESTWPGLDANAVLLVPRSFPLLFSSSSFSTTALHFQTPKMLLLFLLLPFFASPALAAPFELPDFREAPAFRNGPDCAPDNKIHIAMTLDATYLRGSLAGVLSVLRHASCPESINFHFVATSSPRRIQHLRRAVLSAFPSLTFSIYRFDASLVRGKISQSVRRALDQPLNYARIYLSDLLPPTVQRVLYLDSDLLLVDDVAVLWSTPLGPDHVLAAPEYCHANFTAYFTSTFWAHPTYPSVFSDRPRQPCYFNTGVMVIDLDKWRNGDFTKRLETWMEIQKKEVRIYELGSLPPFLLVFAGEVKGVEHRWNQHGLGGDNKEGLCRDLHPGPVSLLHWSGKGKPWLRLDNGRACPLDALWAPYDLLSRNGRDLLADV